MFPEKQTLGQKCMSKKFIGEALRIDSGRGDGRAKSEAQMQLQRSLGNRTSMVLLRCPKLTHGDPCLGYGLQGHSSKET